MGRIVLRFKKFSCRADHESLDEDAPKTGVCMVGTRRKEEAMCVPDFP
jgi:hypothetical protein